VHIWQVPNGTAYAQDTRGPAKGHVCLPERSSHVYYMQAITQAYNNTIRYPPGMDNLLTVEGFKVSTLEDFVRSALFQDEVWRSVSKEPGEPEADTMLLEAAIGESNLLSSRRSAYSPPSRPSSDEISSRNLLYTDQIFPSSIPLLALNLFSL
jgi:hypothetical protein